MSKKGFKEYVVCGAYTVNHRVTLPEYATPFQLSISDGKQWLAFLIPVEMKEEYDKLREAEKLRESPEEEG